MPEPRVPLEALLAQLATTRADEEAWRALYRQMWPFVFAAVYRRLRGDGALAEDASQEVFIRLVRACPFERLRDPEAFRRYLWRVADNVARTYARQVVGRHAAEVLTSEAEASGMDVQRFSRTGEELDAQDLMRRVVGDLTPSDRELLRLVLEGHSLSELAEARGLTYGNAAVQLHRLRQRLRNSLFSKESSQS